MKWMWSTALVVLAVSAGVSAQSGKAMTEPTMGGMMNTTYTGCVVAVNHGGSILLTDIASDHQAMMHDDGAMKGDSAMAKKDEPGAVVLTGRSDLKKHVGQKVTVSGALSHGMSDTMPKDKATLTVSSLKVVGKSCS